MTTTATVEREVRDLVDTVSCAPEVTARQRSEVQGLAGDLLRDQACTNGLNLQLFAAAGVSLGASCERPATPARTCTADDSVWFDDVGIRGRERRDEELESRHFDRVREIGADIERCCSAISEVVSTAETAVRCLLEPVRRTLDIVLRCGITQLVQPAVDLAIEALSHAREATRDRNCVIEQCLEQIAKCVSEAAQDSPAPQVQFEKQGQLIDGSASAPPPSTTGTKLQAGAVGTQAASAPGFEVSFNFGVDAKLDAHLDAKVNVAGFQPPSVPPVLQDPTAMVGAFGAVGAVAALGALECFTSAAECPPCPCPEPASAPAPEPAPAPAPPPPAPAPTPTGTGVIAPPPELADVPEPAPPQEKMAHTQVAAVPAAPDGPASPAAEGAAQPNNAPAEDPWAVKKTGEW